MFCIPNSWVQGAVGTNKEKLKIWKSLVSHIKCLYIKVKYWSNQVKNCGFVDLKNVKYLSEEFKWMFANQSHEEMEQVIVQGVEEEEVNGIYVWVNDDINLGKEEVMFVKEGDDNFPNLGLYLWNIMQAISSCVDYSNVLSCELSQKQKLMLCYHQKPPKWGLAFVWSHEPIPVCTWKPSKHDENLKFRPTKRWHTLWKNWGTSLWTIHEEACFQKKWSFMS